MKLELKIPQHLGRKEINFIKESMSDLKISALLEELENKEKAIQGEWNYLKEWSRIKKKITKN